MHRFLICAYFVCDLYRIIFKHFIDDLDLLSEIKQDLQAFGALSYLICCYRFFLFNC